MKDQDGYFYVDDYGHKTRDELSELDKLGYELDKEDSEEE